LGNTVELIGYYGSDITHAQSAWTSTVRNLSDDKLSRIDKLLNMLASAGHHTPFEKSSLHFLVCTDIASHIHILKHRIGVSVNAESARYKELKEDKRYVPEDWEGIPVNRETYSGDSRFKMGEQYKWTEVLEEYTKIGNQLYHQCIEDLSPSLGRKRAKESARFFKTYNSQIEADVQFNFRSLAHFLNLRNKPDAQLEIREIAAKMLELVRNIEGDPFKLTLEAFNL
jgi:thymidylate synthase (FAD)|tara:strand:- start:99 stop:779 length:681 start_codon:yes stop_codon:yes gene_type:complete